MPDSRARLTLLAPPRMIGEATYPVFGIPTRFESNSAEVLAIAEEAFGAWRALDGRWIEPGGVRVRITVRPGGEGPDEHAPHRYGTPQRHLMIITTPGSRGSADALARAAEAEVTDTLVRDRQHFRYGMLEGLVLAVLTNLDREPVHAAALVRGETALLVAGRSGVGKSSLTYAAMRAGFKVLTEDCAFLQLDPFRVWGMPGYVHVPTDSARFFPELDGTAPAVRANGKTKIAVSARKMCAVAARPVVDHAGICLLARGDGRPALERLSSEDVVRALTTRIEPGFDLFADTIGERIRLLAERGGWRMALPAHPEQAIPLLHQMFDALDRGS